MKLKPILDRVVLEPEKTKDKTAGGIILPPAGEDKSQFAKVIAVGEGGLVDGKEVKMLVSVGQKVLFSKYAGTPINIDGKEFLVVRQADIMAIIE